MPVESPIALAPVFHGVSDQDHQHHGAVIAEKGYVRA